MTQITPRSAGAVLAIVSIVVLAMATPSFAHDDPTHAGGSEAIPSTVPPDDVCRVKGPCDTDHNRPEHGSLANIGAKLSDPTSNVWALQLNIQAPTFYDGDVNTGDPKIGANVIFQPILPFPLYGTGENAWKLITRPIVPLVFSQPTPKGFDEFNKFAGLGDIQLPFLLNLPTAISGHWIIGGGPVFEFPTSTQDALGNQQYSVGPAVVLGYKTKKYTAVVFPNYFFGYANRSDRKSGTRTTSKLSLLYAFTYNLADAWQVGLNPTISYNDKATSGNRWDVPVGLFAAKTIKLGSVPFKVQGGLEYSVVSPDDFGKRLAFRFVLTPVISGLVKNPIFGGS